MAVVGQLEYQFVGFTKTELDETEYQEVMKENGQMSKMAYEIETDVIGETETTIITLSNQKILCQKCTNSKVSRKKKLVVNSFLFKLVLV